VTAIRPNLPPAAPPAPNPRAAEATRLSAQKAFFAIAAGRAPSAPVQPAPAAQPAAAPIAAPPTATAADPAARIPRPGSLLNIRV
jgi:hypothetical protein